MNILFLADNFPPERNAQASRVFERARFWVRWGHKVIVVTCAPNFPEGKVYAGYQNRWRQFEELSGIRVIRVKTFITRNEGTVLRIQDDSSYMLPAFFAGAAERRPDLVAATSPTLFAAVAGWALSVALHVPFVLELSDLWPASIAAVGAMRPNAILRWLEALELFLYRRSAAIVAQTAAFQEDLIRRHIPASKISVVTNGVDLDRFVPRERDLELSAKCGLERGHFVAGYIGTQGMAHALENVLEAAHRVRGSNIRFLFVGTGAARESLIAEAARRNLTNVIFVPPQPKEMMPAFWSLCDAALVHLRNSPVMATVIPSKIFEAMAMGLPIVLASPEGEASRVVSGEGAGVCVPAEDPAALANTVLLLSENRALLERFSECSREAAPRYSRERQARDMLAVLEGVAQTEPRRSRSLRSFL